MYQWDKDSKILKTAKLSKAERLKLLKDNGLNCADYTKITTYEEADAFQLSHESASIRCETHPAGKNMDDVQTFRRASENTYPPHFPFITKYFIAETLKVLLNYKWTPVACEGISLEMNQLAGIIKAIPAHNPNIYDYLVEAALPKDHPIGVRAISHGGKVDIRVKLPNAIADIGTAGVFGEIWQSIKQFRRKPVYLEFSYIKLPVGWKKQRLIFWEYHELKENAV